MIVDLPPDHPVQILSNKVYTILKNQPGIGPFMGPPPRVVVETRTAAEAHGPSYGFHAIADTARERIILYRADSYLGFQPKDKLALISVKMAKIRKNRNLTVEEAESLHLLIHEHFHFFQSGRQYVHMTPSQRAWEEGIVDLNSLTYTQTAGWKLFRDAGAGFAASASYACARRVATYSTIASGARKYTDQIARQWQRRMLVLSPLERDAELYRIGVDPTIDCESNI